MQETTGIPGILSLIDDVDDDDDEVVVVVVDESDISAYDIRHGSYQVIMLDHVTSSS